MSAYSPERRSLPIYAFRSSYFTLTPRFLLTFHLCEIIKNLFCLPIHCCDRIVVVVVVVVELS